MNNKFIRKVQFGGYNKRRYKEVRRKITRLWMKEAH